MDKKPVELKSADGGIRDQSADGAVSAKHRKKTAIRYVGDYVLLGEIAHGGMGVVYRGRQISLNRPVAVKMIRSDRVPSLADIQRFRTEAEAVALLEHKNIVSIYEINEHEGQPYFSMPLIEGTDLAHKIGENPLHPKCAAEILIQVAQAVHHAHQRGVLHRDLKPSNILLDEASGKSPHPVVTDFGLAKLVEGERDLSLTGAVLGTIEYMAPEQAAGKSRQVTTEADIYSLGAILFAMLTGRPPFPREAGTNDLALLLRVQKEEPPSPRSINPSCDRDLETICLACLEKEPSERYASAEDVAKDLERWLQGEPISRNPPGIIDRVYRWIRRKLVVAALTFSLVIVVLSSIIGMAWLWQRAETHANQEMQQRQYFEEALSQLEMQTAEQYFAADDAATGVAYLAKCLRRDPGNVAAIERIFSAFLRHNFARPLGQPLLHDAPVRSAQFSPDGTRLVTRSLDNTARIWDAITGLPLSPPLRHNNVVMSAEFSRDGERVATASWDGTARLWDGHNGKALLHTLRQNSGLWFAHFSPDGAQLVTGSHNGNAVVWDVRTGKVISRFQGHNDAVVAAAFSPDGERVATGSHDSTARVWNLRTGRSLTQPLRHDYVVQPGTVRFSPDGNYIATASADKTARVWDARTGEPRTPPLRHDDLVNAAEFSPDGRYLATASHDKTARVWDIETGEPVTPPLKHKAQLELVRFSPEGSRVVTASWDYTARVWGARTGLALTEPLRHRGNVWDAEFSPDGLRVITAAGDRTARIWNVRATALTEPLRHDQEVKLAEFSPDGTQLATASGVSIVLWDVQQCRITATLPTQASRVTVVHFSPDATELLVAAGRAARIWDAKTLQPKADPMLHDVAVISAEFSRNGQSVATVAGRIVRVWESRSAAPLSQPLTHKAFVNSAEFSPDAKLLIAGCQDSTATLWNIENGQPATAPIRHKAEVNYAEFSPDGQRVVTAGADSIARVWDARTGKPLTEPLDHSHWVEWAHFSPDGNSLVTVAGNQAQVWDGHTGQPLTDPLLHDDRITCVFFSKDGARVVTASEDHTARVWNARSGLPVSGALKHLGPVWIAQFNPDGDRVITASADRTARVWEIPIAPGPAPPWFAAWAEAAAGRRFNERGALDVPEADALATISLELHNHVRANFYTRFANWQSDEDANPKLSPDSPFRLADYIARRIEENNVQSLREAIQLSPTNIGAVIRLAQLLINGAPDTGRLAEADACVRQVLNLPNNTPETLQSINEIKIAISQSRDRLQ